MHHRYTTPRRPQRRDSPWSAVAGLAFLVVIGGCVAYAASSVLRLDSSPTQANAPATGYPATTIPTAAGHPPRGPRPTPAVTVAPPTSATPERTETTERTERPRATATARPTPRPTPRLHPRPHKGPFGMDIYRRNAMVSELEPWWCMPAAMQTIMNIIDGGKPDRSYATQRRLYGLARRLSTDRLDGKGAEPVGWASGLTRLGYGRYIVSVHRTRADAIHTAAQALRMTGRPVGIIAWRGAHSWVMSGFRATADPALTNHFVVTQVAIEDVWYPRISSIWGPSTPPDTWIPVERLPQDYLPYRRPGVRYPGLDGRFLLVLPVGPVASGSR